MKKLMTCLALMPILCLAAAATMAHGGENLDGGKPYLFVGLAKTYLVNMEGELWCWDNKGEAIIGSDERAYKPEKIFDHVRCASNNDNHTVIVTRDDELWAYGSNKYGQLGDGGRLDKPSPVKVMGGVAYAETGRNYTVILKTNGELWMCGLNPAYWGPEQITGEANGPEEAILSPVKIMDGVKDVSSGASHVMVIKENGELWGWGDNQHGAIGNGTREGVLEPEMVMKNVKSVSASHSKTVAVDGDGRTWEWGMLGKDANDPIRDTIYVSPKEVGKNFKTAYAGWGYSLGLQDNGSLQIWGKSDFTQNNDYFYTPETLLEGAFFVTAAAGQNCAAAVDRNGEAKFWAKGADATWLGNYIPKPVTIMTGLTVPAGDPATTIAPAGKSAPALPTTARTYVNDKHVPFDAYNINGNNYYKLRDIAYALMGTKCKFGVGWLEDSATIVIGLDGGYKPAGGELGKGGGAKKNATVSNAKLIAAPQSVLDAGNALQIQNNYKVSANAYVIDGNTYFKLRDLGAIIGFRVVWDESASAVIILTE